MKLKFFMAVAIVGLTISIMIMLDKSIASTNDCYVWVDDCEISCRESMLGGASYSVEKYSCRAVCASVIGYGDPESDEVCTGSTDWECGTKKYWYDSNWQNGEGDCTSYWYSPGMYIKSGPQMAPTSTSCY